MTSLSRQRRMLEERASCLIERGYACIAGFERLGMKFSANTTRQMVTALEAGAPAYLYDWWIPEQEARLRSAEVTCRMGVDRG